MTVTVSRVTQKNRFSLAVLFHQVFWVATEKASNEVSQGALGGKNNYISGYNSGMIAIIWKNNR